MNIYRLSQVERLDVWRQQWEQLAEGVPFRRLEWLESWWRFYGEFRRSARPEHQRDVEPYVVCLFDECGHLAAAAPWFLERTRSGLRVLKFLGAGEVCSDHVTVLCRPGLEEDVAYHLAQWMAARGCGGAGDHEWDVLELSGVSAADGVMTHFVEYMRQAGCSWHPQRAGHGWRLELPDNWNEYLGRLSKSHRKQVRRVERNLIERGRAIYHEVDCDGKLSWAGDLLIELHQRRWEQLGRPGCFSSARFAAFHREVMQRFLDLGALRLAWVEVDKQPVAAEYQLCGAGGVFAYQSGIDPQSLQLQPGRISTLFAVQSAIRRGDKFIDFLRGDEPYKAHWRAEPYPLWEARLVAGRTGARVHHGMWAARNSLDRIFRHGLKRAGSWVACLA